jgi:hypothetical protein
MPDRKGLRHRRSLASRASVSTTICIDAHAVLPFANSQLHDQRDGLQKIIRPSRLIQSTTAARKTKVALSSGGGDLHTGRYHIMFGQWPGGAPSVTDPRAHSAHRAMTGRCSEDSATAPSIAGPRAGRPFCASVKLPRRDLVVSGGSMIWRPDRCTSMAQGQWGIK